MAPADTYHGTWTNFALLRLSLFLTSAKSRTSRLEEGIVEKGAIDCCMVAQSDECAGETSVDISQKSFGNVFGMEREVARSSQDMPCAPLSQLEMLKAAKGTKTGFWRHGTEKLLSPDKLITTSPTLLPTDGDVGRKSISRTRISLTPSVESNSSSESLGAHPRSFAMQARADSCASSAKIEFDYDECDPDGKGNSGCSPGCAVM